MLERQGKLVYRSGGFPLLTVASLAVMLLTLATTPLNRGQIPGLVMGAAEFGLISLVYLLFVRPRERAPGGGRRVEVLEPGAPEGDRVPNT